MFTKKTIKKAFYIFSLCILSVILLLIAIYFINIQSINQEYYKRYNDESEVALRKFPYPYKAAMAISSDIDNTETLEEFLEIEKFLNTREITSMGEGLGLEIGNSFFFYEPADQAISYFLSSPSVRESIISFIKLGQIDVMHSYGKKSDFTREDAVKSLTELKKNNCKLDVWVDHDRSISNFGDDVTFGLGDHPDSKAYHADLTLNYGIKFVWLGRVTMITGQSTPITLGTYTRIYDSQYPVHSLINVSKEFGKNILAFLGNKKYRMHKNNDLVKITTLDDGKKVYEFIRFDNYWKGVSTGADAEGLAYVISKKVIDRLKEVNGYMIVYTHFGKNKNSTQYIPKTTQDALRNLEKEYREGNIFVTTTSKLLNYYINHKYLNWSYQSKDNEAMIHIHSVKDPIFGPFIPKQEDLQGITFYIPNKRKTRVYLEEQELENIQSNPVDHTGRESVTIPLKHLKFPDD